MSDSLWPHGLQHARPPCPSPSPGVCPSSCSLPRWCCAAISFPDALSCCPQSFPASRTFPTSWLFTSDDQNTGASASVLPVNIQAWSFLTWTGLISLFSKGLPGAFSSERQFEGTNSLVFCLLYCPALTTVSDHWEGHSLDYTDLCQVMSLLFNTLSRFVIAFLPRSYCLLISWLQSLSAVILEPKKRKSVAISAFYPSVCHAAMGLNAMILVVGFFFFF